jgi:hypothetical protein
MRLQELMDIVIIVELSTTFLKIVDPAETCALNRRRKVLLYSTVLYVSHKGAGSAHATHILLKSRDRPGKSRAAFSNPLDRLHYIRKKYVRCGSPYALDAMLELLFKRQ